MQRARLHGCVYAAICFRYFVCFARTVEPGYGAESGLVAGAAVDRYSVTVVTLRVQARMDRIYAVQDQKGSGVENFTLELCYEGDDTDTSESPLSSFPSSASFCSVALLYSSPDFSPLPLSGTG